MPESSHSDSLKPGSPTVRESTKPANMPAQVSAPSAQPGRSPVRHTRTAAMPQAIAPSTKRTPTYACSQEYSGASDEMDQTGAGQRRGSAAAARGSGHERAPLDAGKQCGLTSIAGRGHGRC